MLVLDDIVKKLPPSTKYACVMSGIVVCGLGAQLFLHFALFILRGSVACEFR